LLLSTVYFRITARAPVTRARAPSLERLLARADARAQVADWRAQAFRLIAAENAQTPAVATAAFSASDSGAAGAWVCIATPVHFLAGMSSVSLPPDGILALDPSEADALGADFNGVFGGEGVRLIRGRDSVLLLLFDAPLRATMTPPEDVAGRDIWTHLPRGTDSRRVRRLMSEIEMWLFEHAVNEHRRARSTPIISGLWPWGEGRADVPPPAVHGWTAGDDPLFGAYPRESRYPGADRSGVVAVSDWPGTPAWRDVEDRWLMPALGDLRSGRLRSIDLSAGNLCYSLSAGALRRFWRRARPWWETLKSDATVDSGHS
jgi:hypothetical protein